MISRMIPHPSKAIVSAIAAALVAGAPALASASAAFPPEHRAQSQASQGHISVVATSAASQIGEETVQGARTFISSMAQRGIEFLSNNGLSHEQKTRKFRQLLQDSFDLDTIARFSLGRYWRQATEPQKKEYVKLFKEMVIDVYSNRFSDYKGQEFEVAGSQVKGNKDIFVETHIKTDEGQKVQVDWRVRYTNGQYKVIDVIVEGVSMALTQRSDFASVIQRGGGNVEVLLTHLKKK